MIRFCETCRSPFLVYCTRISPDSFVRRAGRPSGLLHPSLTGFARVGKWHQALLPQCDIMLPPNWWVVSIREGSVHLPRTPFDRGLPPMGPGFVEQGLVAAQGPPQFRADTKLRSGSSLHHRHQSWLEAPALLLP